MKTFLATLAVVVGGITLATSAQAAPCPNLASLQGTYGYVASGFAIQNLSAGGFGNPFFGAYAASGEFTITNNTVSVTDTVSINGSVYRQQNYSGTVTYSPVTAFPGGNQNNCLGTLSFNSGVLRATYDFAVVQGGAKLLLVDTEQGTSISGSAER